MESVDTVGMIMVMMGAKNGNQPEIVPIKIIQNRGGITGIDHHRVLLIVQRPDIVVPECRESNNFYHESFRSLTGHTQTKQD